MKVLLIDFDSTIPNLALMKISAYHKKGGDIVGFNVEVKDRFNKMTNETIEELDGVIERLSNMRQLYKPYFIDCPDMDRILKNQIDELKRINDWIKKEVM